MSSRTDSPELMTHGSDQRPSRPLHTALQRIHVATLATELRAEDAYASDGRCSKTIHDDGQTRIIVSAVAQGGVVGADSNQEHVMLAMDQGQGKLHRAEAETELSPGSVVIIAPGASWTFEAGSECAFMATFWRGGEPAPTTAA